MNHHITASTLYALTQCPHRVWRDIHGPQEEKSIEVNPFVEMLWEKGVKHEKEIIAKIGDFVNLGLGSIEERFEKTLQAMQKGSSLIYQGVIKHDTLLGIPDVLKKLANGEYIAIDIKSGSATEGENEDDEEGEGKPKKHYAVQLCLYNDILKKLGFSTHNSGKIIDIHQKEVEYDFSSTMGVKNKKTWQEFYEESRNEAEQLISNKKQNKPAMAGICKLCSWYKSCKDWCKESQDLTNIFYVGRSVRDVMERDLKITNINELLEIDIKEIIDQKEIEKKAGNKEFLYRISDNTLDKMKKRGRMLLNQEKPVIYSQINLPRVEYELFLDIEDDPTQEFVYMHGIVERRAGQSSQERFIDFTAKEISPQAEKQAWQDLWKYIKSLPQDNFAVYYYSPHEKTTYKKLAKTYPDVISLVEVEEFFKNSNVIDLYGVILKHTDWPLSSYSIKEIATYLGFKWRDETPSGALSIQWFNDYITTKDENVLKRILEYNEDDCRATRILKDGIEKLLLN